MKIFVFWQDYDSAWCNEFETREDAEPMVAMIRRKQEAQENGTHLLKVVEGKELTAEVSQRIEVIRLKEAAE